MSVYHTLCTCSLFLFSFKYFWAFHVGRREMIGKEGKKREMGNDMLQRPDSTSRPPVCRKVSYFFLVTRASGSS